MVDLIWWPTSEILDVVDRGSVARSPAPRIVGEGRKRRIGPAGLRPRGPNEPGGIPGKLVTNLSR